jgi:rubrerythrin
MSGPTTVDEILDFGIQNEQNAVDLYTKLAGQAKSKSAQALFEQFAGEERGHKAKLIEVKNGKQLLGSASAIQDLKIGDYLVEEKLDDDPDYQSVLIFAMHQEKAAFRLYTDLAARTDDAGIKELLLGLAQEEAKHKLRFEIEYDENVLQEN